VLRYFAKTLRSLFRRGIGLYLLTLFGVALGVASVLAIQIINRSAVGAFRGGIRAVSGEADLSVQGLTPTISERLIADVLATAGVRAAWPICEYQIQTESEPSLRLKVLGLDLLRPTPVMEEEEGISEEILTVDGWVAVSEQLAQQMKWRDGSSFPVSIGSRTKDLVVGTVFDFQQLFPQLSTRVLLMDLAQAQSLLGSRGEIHRIDISIEEGILAEEVASSLKTVLGDGVEVLTPSERMDQAEGLLSAFRLNLTALSLISLFVASDSVMLNLLWIDAIT